MNGPGEFYEKCFESPCPLGFYALLAGKYYQCIGGA